jgi:hypothetical protein
MMKLGRIVRLTNKVFRSFSEVVPSKGEAIPTSLQPQDLLNEISKTSLGLPESTFTTLKKTGTDIFLTSEKMNKVEKIGLFFNDVNDEIDLESVSHKGWKLQYLKNMLLLQDYNSIFRDFLQSCALSNPNGLGLTCEPRLKRYVQANLATINRLGYNMEIESLKIMQDYKILRVEIYKNLNMERDSNKSHDNYSFNKLPTPLGPLVVAHEKGNDHSIVKSPRPFILATTMLVQSPMKMAFFNQNLTKKLHGRPEDEKINYVVRFESQFSYSDFGWILPTQNKPNRLRNTRITDFNNVLRGNPFFENKFDLVNDTERFRYMNRNENADSNVREFIYATKTSQY